MAWDRWQSLSESARQQVAPLATSAAITLGSWERARHFIQAFPRADHEGGFYRAVLALHEGDFATALDEVAKSRAILATNLAPLTEEGYQRAYPVSFFPIPLIVIVAFSFLFTCFMHVVFTALELPAVPGSHPRLAGLLFFTFSAKDLVGAQLLSEVEEVIHYKLIPERRPILHEAWHYRLLGCQSVVEDWGRVIQLRRLVLDPRENIRSCLRYAGLCRRSGRLASPFKFSIFLYLDFDAW